MRVTEIAFTHNSNWICEMDQHPDIKLKNELLKVLTERSVQLGSIVPFEIKEWYNV